jgi:glutamine amidotransferase
LTQPSPEVAVVDYGMGNLRNVARTLERAGAKPRVTADPGDVLRADRVIVPGVGALGDAMRCLRMRGLDLALSERIVDGRPYLGICLGLEILLEDGEEGAARCLGLCPGTVTRFRDVPRLPVPHMGWNAVQVRHPHPVLRDGFFYFVHSYRGSGVPADRVLALTDYGGEFASAIGFDACLAVQFHPEKSQRAGLALLERFCAWQP